MKTHDVLADRLRCAIGRREFLGATAAGAIATYAGGPRVATAAEDRSAHTSNGRRPNIILIVADDLGYGDLGIHGCSDIPTPNIDSIAASGVRFTQGYVSCPVCSPTRAGLLTGRYQQRFGHEFNPGPEPDRAVFGLPLTEITLAEILKRAGYATGMVGKWHLGFQPDRDPTQRGFDEFYGFLGGAHSYQKLAPDGERSIFRGAEAVDEPEHLTDAFAREAEAFIERHKQEPFLLYLPFNAVHNPLEPDPRYADRFAAIPDERRRKYAGLLAGLDDAVGRVLAKIRDTSLEKGSLIVFISDNGGPSANGSSNGALNATKGTVYEGGVRVPFFMQWKGTLPEGVTYDKPAISLDILPTAAAVAAAPLPGDRPIDGVNLIPFITGRNAAQPHEYLYWRFGEQAAVRSKEWKLVRTAEGGEQLFHLVSDSSERHNCLADQAVVADELRQAYAQWESNLMEPRWTGRRRRQAQNQ